jgi:hypothetical protein
MWRWQPDPGVTEQGVEIPKSFESQAKAEVWLTAHYEDLQDAGVSTVTLYEEDRVVYGPMSLAPG